MCTIRVTPSSVPSASITNPGGIFTQSVGSAGTAASPILPAASSAPVPTGTTLPSQTPSASTPAPATTTDALRQLKDALNALMAMMTNMLGTAGTTASPAASPAPTPAPAPAPTITIPTLPTIPKFNVPPTPAPAPLIGIPTLPTIPQLTFPPTPAPAPVAVQAPPPAAAPAPAPAPRPANVQPVIVQLDDFVTAAGDTNEQILTSQGAKVVPINVNKDQTQSRATSVAQGIDQVLQMVQSGQQVDVVNIQQQDFAPSADSAHIRSVVDQLSALGIPVVISAGLSQSTNINGERNQFGTANSFNVQAVDNLGGVTPLPGNVSHTGTHAPARVSVEIATLKAQGATLAQIRQALGVV